MPDGKFSNVCGYLKFLNLLRVGNCDIDTDVASTIESFVISLKKIIGTDAEFASKALQRFGARHEVHQVVPPIGVDLEDKKPLGDKDGVSQFTTDMTVKPFLNIHDALSLASSRRHREYRSHAGSPRCGIDGPFVRSLLDVHRGASVGHKELHYNRPEGYSEDLSLGPSKD